MASLGSKLVRNILAKDMLPDAGLAAGSMVGAAAGGLTDDDPALGGLLGGVAGGLLGRKGGGLAARTLRKSGMVGNPRMKGVHKEYQSFGEDGGNLTYAFKVAPDHAVNVHFSDYPESPGQYTVMMGLQAKYKPTLAETRKIFQETFNALDDHSAKIGGDSYVFIGDTPSKTKLYRNALKKGLIPEGYKAFETDDGLKVVRKGAVGRVKKDYKKQRKEALAYDFEMGPMERLR